MTQFQCEKHGIHYGACASCLKEKRQSQEQEHIDSLKRQIELLTLGLLQEKNKASNLLERLEKTTKYLEIRTKKQSKYSILRLVDKIIEANKAAIAEAKKG